MFNLHFIFVACKYNPNISHQYSINTSQWWLFCWWHRLPHFQKRPFPFRFDLWNTNASQATEPCAAGTCYLGNRLKLAVCVMNQVHQGADGSRGVEIFRQSIKNAGFSFSQPGGNHQSYRLAKTRRWRHPGAVTGAATGAAVPLPEEGFLHRRTLQLTLHVSLSVVDEAGDGRQGTPGLRHAAVAVVNGWENTNALKTLPNGFFFAPSPPAPPDLYLVKRQNIRNSLAE